MHCNASRSCRFENMAQMILLVVCWWLVVVSCLLLASSVVEAHGQKRGRGRSVIIYCGNRWLSFTPRHVRQ